MLRDKRLKTLYDLTPACSVAADIGTDHGILGCELLKGGRCEKMWFTDISADSLLKARLLVDKEGLNDRAEFFCGDGASVLPKPPSAAIIAGMGGRTICHIINEGRQKLLGTKLILGANTALNELRTFLSQNGYKITDEAALSEAGKYYVVIFAEEGEMSLDEMTILAGPVLSAKNDEDTKTYFSYRLRGAQIALERARSSESADTTNLEKELKIWQGLI